MVFSGSSLSIEDARAAAFRRLSLLCGVFAVLVGGTALVGWATGNDLLKGGWAHGINLKSNTALSLVVAGLGLILVVPGRPGTLRRWLVRTAGALLAFIGLATLSQHLFGWDLGIDQALFQEPPGAPGTSAPNRMGPPASTCFPLIGASLWMLARRAGRGTPWQPLGCAVLVIALLPLLGYVFQVRELYGIARFTGIALHTAITLSLLGLGILLSRPDRGAMRLFIVEDPGGTLVRRLMPAAIVLPVLLAWLRVVGEQQGLYATEFGRTLLVLSFVVVFSILIWLVAGAISRQAAARARAELAELELRDHLVELERNARAAAENANRSKDEFLATLSHELRTPLHAILGWAEVLAKSNQPADLERGLAAIERNARLQARLIEDLLDTSRIVSGTLRLELTDVHLAPVIDAAIAAVAPAAADKRLVIEREVDAAAGPVRGDAARLQQILWNLLSNAIAFTPVGGRVTVRLVRQGARALLTVSDEGEGMAAELIDQMFERFRQGDASSRKRHGGLGLGLAIARQLAELHGGRLGAASAGPGRGATFTLELPIVTPSAAALAIASEKAAAPSPDALAGVRVLVVDDQPDGRELVARILSASRATVAVAEGAARALELLDRDGYDVLVSDIAMPGRDGYELIEDVRSRYHELPAIALTAFAAPEDAERARRAGFQVHLAKPLDPATLVAAIAELAGTHDRAR